MRRRRKLKNKKQVVRIVCRYCASFWSSPSRSEGRGKAATVYRRCITKGEEVTGDTAICEDFTLSNNIHCEKFSNRMDNVCCLARRRHGYGYDYCIKKCPQVAIIESSYAAMGLPMPEPRRPDISKIRTDRVEIGDRPSVGLYGNGQRVKSTLKRVKRESVKVVRRLKRRSKPSKPVSKKLRRRRSTG